MHTGQQHPDEDECHRRQGKIGNFGRKIGKNVARRHDEPPNNRCVINLLGLYVGLRGTIYDSWAGDSFRRLVRARTSVRYPHRPHARLVTCHHLDPLSSDGRELRVTPAMAADVGSVLI
jgi:hypothetical protein